MSKLFARGSYPAIVVPFVASVLFLGGAATSLAFGIPAVKRAQSDRNAPKAPVLYILLALLLVTGAILTAIVGVNQIYARKALNP